MKLDVTVLSAEDLRLAGHRISKHSYAVVSTLDMHDVLSTNLDNDGGGSYPRWNETLHLPFASSASTSSFTVEVHCKSGVRDRMIGAAKVPLSDVVAGYIPAHLVHFLSYRLRDKDGERNGIINLAVKLVGFGGSPAGWPAAAPPPRKIPMGMMGRIGAGEVVVGVPGTYPRY